MKIMFKVEKLLELVIIGNIVLSIDETLFSLMDGYSCVTKYDWYTSTESTIKPKYKRMQ